mgnify:FL=1
MFLSSRLATRLALMIAVCFVGACEFVREDDFFNKHISEIPSGEKAEKLLPATELILRWLDLSKATAANAKECRRLVEKAWEEKPAILEYGKDPRKIKPNKIKKIPTNVFLHSHFRAAVFEQAYFPWPSWPSPRN